MGERQQLQVCPLADIAFTMSRHLIFHKLKSLPTIWHHLIHTGVKINSHDFHVFLLFPVTLPASILTGRQTLESTSSLLNGQSEGQLVSPEAAAQRMKGRGRERERSRRRRRRRRRKRRNPNKLNKKCVTTVCPAVYQTLCSFIHLVNLFDLLSSFVQIGRAHV